MQRKQLGVLQNLRREKQCRFWRHSKKSSVFIRMPGFSPPFSWFLHTVHLSHSGCGEGKTTAEVWMCFISLWVRQEPQLNHQSISLTAGLWSVLELYTPSQSVQYQLMTLLNESWVFLHVFACVSPPLFCWLWRGLPALLNYIWLGYNFREETVCMYQIARV